MNNNYTYYNTTKLVTYRYINPRQQMNQSWRTLWLTGSRRLVGLTMKPAIHRELLFVTASLWFVGWSSIVRSDNWFLSTSIWIYRNVLTYSVSQRAVLKVEQKCFRSECYGYREIPSSWPGNCYKSLPHYIIPNAKSKFKWNGNAYIIMHAKIKLGGNLRLFPLHKGFNLALLCCSSVMFRHT